MLTLPGYLAAILSTFFASAKDIVSKRLSFSVDGTVSAFASFFFALPYYLVFLLVLFLFGKESFTISSAFLRYVILRSITDTFAELLKMHALSCGELSVVANLLSLSPLFLIVTSPMITGDKLPIQGVIAMFLLVAGSLLLLYRPTSKLSNNPEAVPRGSGISKKGIGLALGSAFFFSLNSCFDRLAVKEASATLSGFGMTLLSAIFLLPFVVRNRERCQALKTGRNFFLLRGFFETAFMVCKLFALQYLQAPYVSGIQRISLLLSIVGGKVFFQEADFEKKLLVGVMIVAGTILIIWAQASG